MKKQKRERIRYDVPTIWYGPGCDWRTSAHEEARIRIVFPDGKTVWGMFNEYDNPRENDLSFDFGDENVGWDLENSTDLARAFENDRSCFTRRRRGGHPEPKSSRDSIRLMKDWDLKARRPEAIYCGPLFIDSRNKP